MRQKSESCHYIHIKSFLNVRLTIVSTLLVASPVAAQLEIASLIGGLLGGGGGAGLAGLAGPAASAGLAGLAGPAASAGATGALGNLGTIYNLAQAALQLTGTGVGIANQASESSWFPVLVENAAKMNRDFQERLIGGTGPLGSRSGKPATVGGTGTVGRRPEPEGSGAMGNLGKEYGKKFDSIEDLEVEKAIVTREPPSIALPSLPVQPSGRELPNLIGLLPGEFPTSEIEGTGQPNSKTQVEGVEKSVEEVKVTEQTSSTTTTPQPEPEISSKIPKITFELPKPKQEAAMPTSELLKKTANSSTAGTTTLIDYEDSEAEKKGDKDPKTLIEQVEFSSDKDPEVVGTDEDRKLPPLLPPRANPLPPEFTKSKIEGMEELVAMGISVPPEIIPELKKLIKDLKTGNLTKDEFMEISEQLAGNEDASAPRQNTELPLSDPDDESTKTSGNHGDREEGKIPNPGKERSTHRNLVALNRAYNDSEVETKNKKAKIIIVEHPVISKGSIDIPPSLIIKKRVVHDPAPALRELFKSLTPPIRFEDEDVLSHSRNETNGIRVDLGRIISTTPTKRQQVTTVSPIYAGPVISSTQNDKTQEETLPIVDSESNDIPRDKIPPHSRRHHRQYSNNVRQFNEAVLVPAALIAPQTNTKNKSKRVRSNRNHAQNFAAANRESLPVPIQSYQYYSHQQQQSNQQYPYPRAYNANTQQGTFNNNNNNYNYVNPINYNGNLGTQQNYNQQQYYNQQSIPATPQYAYQRNQYYPNYGNNQLQNYPYNFNGQQPSYTNNNERQQYHNNYSQQQQQLRNDYQQHVAGGSNQVHSSGTSLKSTDNSAAMNPRRPQYRNNQNGGTTYPQRFVHDNALTTPPSEVYHPYGQGALLTLMQPNVLTHRLSVG